MSGWLDLLRQAVATHPRGCAGVAEQLGYSRSAVSMVLAGSYPARTDKLARAVLATYDRADCPHTGAPITRADCRAQALRPAPTSSPRDMRHWRACQGCKNKPTE